MPSQRSKLACMPNCPQCNPIAPNPFQLPPIHSNGPESMAMAPNPHVDNGALTRPHIPSLCIPSVVNPRDRAWHNTGIMAIYFITFEIWISGLGPGVGQSEVWYHVRGVTFHARSIYNGPEAWLLWITPFSYFSKTKNTANTEVAPRVLIVMLDQFVCKFVVFYFVLF